MKILTSKLHHVRMAILCCAALMGPTVCAHAQKGDEAQAFPTRPVRLIVTSEAGSAPDVMARILGVKLGEALGQQVVVDNRAGAGGLIGYEIASKAFPDGHTIVMSTIALITTSTIHKKLPYHPVESFTQISNFASLPYVLVVAPSMPVNSVKQLVEYAKTQPGKLNYGSPGNGTAQHLTTELLKMQTGINLVHVPYKSGASAVNGILTGEAQLFFAGLPPAFPHVKAGRLRALAVTTPRRFPSVPEIPTMAEAGISGFEVDSWQAVIGPAKMPRDRVQLLNDRIGTILKMPEVRKGLLSSGADANPSSPEALAKLVRAELVRWTAAAKAAGLQPQ